MVSEIEMKVRQIIKNNLKTKVPVETIGGDELLDSFGISSMNFIRIIVEIENEFGFAFTNETLKFEDLNTLNKLVAHIALQVNSSGFHDD